MATGIRTRPTLGSASSQGATIGLIMARAAGAARRVAIGEDLTDPDRESLRRAGEMLRGTADALQFAESHGRSGSRPRNFTAVEFVVEMQNIRSEPQERWVLAIRNLADAVDGFAENGDSAVAPSLVTLFSSLSASATRDAGSVGEQINLRSRS